MLRSYSKPLNVGHKFLDGLFDSPVVVQEKVDGSQFSFGVVDGELFCRSRKVNLDLDSAGMFQAGVDTVRRLYDEDKLVDGWTYRGEYLQKPKHNTLAYERVPVGHIILFDIDISNQEYLEPDYLALQAYKLGLESVPLLAKGIPSLETLKSLLDEESVLGGCKIEGVVIKNYSVIGADGKIMMAKLVSEDFKEQHSHEWKKSNPNRNDIIDRIIADYGSYARWEKAVQHLTEQGELQQAPQDIPLLMREVAVDFEDECVEDIKEILWSHFRKQILKGVQSGLPEWYKRKLVEDSFDEI